MREKTATKTSVTVGKKSLEDILKTSPMIAFAVNSFILFICSPSAIFRGIRGSANGYTFITSEEDISPPVLETSAPFSSPPAVVVAAAAALAARAMMITLLGTFFVLPIIKEKSFFFPSLLLEKDDDDDVEDDDDDF